MKKIVCSAALLLLIMSANLMAQNRGDGWPSANILKQFGVEGMPQPAGASEVFWRGDWEQVSNPASNMTRGNPALLIQFRGTGATGTVIKNWFERNGWEAADNYFRADGAYRNGNAGAYYNYNTSEGTGQIVAGVIPEVGKNSLLYGTWINSLNGKTIIFAPDGWEWVEWFGGEYVYDGTKLTLDYLDYQTDQEQTTTTTATISGGTLTIGRFSGGIYAEFFNKDLPGRYSKQ